MNPIYLSLLGNAPSIVEAAVKVYEKVSKQEESSVKVAVKPESRDFGAEISSLKTELDKVESLNTSQAEVVKLIAEQQKAMVESMASASRKLDLAIVISSGAILLSLTAIVISVL